MTLDKVERARTRVQETIRTAAEESANERPPRPEGGSSHYQGSSIQVIEFIEANDTPYHEGNVIKYVHRWRKKGGLDDLRKALWYINRLIELEESR